MESMTRRPKQTLLLSFHFLVARHCRWKLIMSKGNERQPDTFATAKLESPSRMKRRITRTGWRVKRLSLAVLFLVSLQNVFTKDAMAMAQKITLTNSLERAGLNLERFGDPFFVTDVESMSDAQSMIKLRPILPHSFLVVNNTGRYVWGFTIIYSYPGSISPSGAAEQYRQNCFSGFRASRSRLLAPGDKYLVTPVSGIWAKSSKAGTGDRHISVDYDSAPRIDDYVQNHVSSNEEVAISVDSLVFEDGELEGPDTTARLESINDQVRAENDIRAALLDKTEVEQTLYLNTLITKPANGAYGVHINALAGHFLALVNQHKPDEMNQMLEGMKNPAFRNNPTVHRRNR